MTSNRLTNLIKKMTPEEQELFVSLQFEATNEEKPLVIESTLAINELIDEQKILAKQLSDEYQFGSENRIVDKTKAQQYEARFHALNNNIFSAETNYLTTENVHWLMGWFTSIRLFLTRANKISFSSGGKPFLPGLFAIGGFSYAITFLIDVIEVLFCTFYPEKSKTEEDLSWSEIFKLRFTNVFLNDKKRLSRMANDALWFAFNLATFILTGGLVAIISITGFAFDLLHEVVISGLEYRKYNNLLMKIKKEQSVLRNECNNFKNRIQKLNSEIAKLQEQLPNKQNQISIENKQKELDQETAAFEQYKKDNEALNYQLYKMADQIKQKKRDAMTTRIRVVVGTAIALLGMLIILYPPVGLPMAALIGSSLALFGGSVMIGLGKRLYDLAVKYVPKVIQILKGEQENISSSNSNESVMQNTSSENLISNKIPPVSQQDENFIPLDNSEKSDSLVILKDEDKREPKKDTTYRDYFKPILPKIPSDPIIISSAQPRPPASKPKQVVQPHSFHEFYDDEISESLDGYYADTDSYSDLKPAYMPLLPSSVKVN